MTFVMEKFSVSSKRHCVTIPKDFTDDLQERWSQNSCYCIHQWFDKQNEGHYCLYSLYALNKKKKILIAGSTAITATALPILACSGNDSKAVSLEVNNNFVKNSVNKFQHIERFKIVLSRLDFYCKETERKDYCQYITILYD